MPNYVIRLSTFLYLLIAILSWNIKAGIFELGEHYFEKIGDKGDIPGGAVTAIAQDQSGLMWFGSQSGLIKFDGYNFTHYTTENSNLSGNYIQSLWVASDGKLWIGTNQNGLLHYQPKLNTFKHFISNKNDPNSLSNNKIYSLTEDDKGGIWIGTGKGLNYLPQNSHQFIRFDSDNNQLHNNHISALLYTKDKKLWVGSNNGVYLLQNDGRTFKSVCKDKNNHSLFSGQTIRSLMQGWDNKIWVGTKDNGAHWFIPGEQCNSLSLDKNTAGHLAHPFVSTMTQPNENEVWLATAGGGISIYDTNLGYVVKINNRLVNFDLSKTLRLKSTDKTLSIEFSALDYSAPKKNKYAYILEGFDSHWQEKNSDHRTADYTNLDPGNYRLVIKGSNRLGQWSSHQLTIAIIQLPAWQLPKYGCRAKTI